MNSKRMAETPVFRRLTTDTTHRPFSRQNRPSRKKGPQSPAAVTPERPSKRTKYICSSELSQHDKLLVCYFDFVFGGREKPTYWQHCVAAGSFAAIKLDHPIDVLLRRPKKLLSPKKKVIVAEYEILRNKFSDTYKACKVQSGSTLWNHIKFLRTTFSKLEQKKSGITVDRISELLETAADKSIRSANREGVNKLVRMGPRRSSKRQRNQCDSEGGGEGEESEANPNAQPNAAPSPLSPTINPMNKARKRGESKNPANLKRKNGKKGKTGALPKVSTPWAIPGLRNQHFKISKAQEDFVKVFELLLSMRLFLKVHENMYSYRDVWTDCIHETDGETGDNNRPFIVVMALILSAKEGDYSVMKSMVELSSRGLCHPHTMAKADVKEVASLLKMGIQNEKAKYLVQTAKVVVDKHNGQVPCNYRKLMDLPGVGDKAAKAIMQEAFNVVMEVPVDSHLSKIFKALKWVPWNMDSPEKISASVTSWMPAAYHKELNPCLAGLGQLMGEVRKRKIIIEYAFKSGEQLLIDAVVAIGHAYDVEIGQAGDVVTGRNVI